VFLHTCVNPLFRGVKIYVSVPHIWGIQCIIIFLSIYILLLFFVYYFPPLEVRLMGTLATFTCLRVQSLKNLFLWCSSWYHEHGCGCGRFIPVVPQKIIYLCLILGVDKASLYSYPFIPCYSVLCTIFHHWRFVSWVLLLPLHNYMCSPSKIYSSCAPLDTRYMVVDVAYLWLVSVLLVKRSFLVKFMCTCYSILLNTSFSLLMLECGCFIEEKF